MMANEDLLRDVLTTLQKNVSNSSTEQSTLDKRLSLVENTIQNHMEWEERNGEDIRDILKAQQSSIERIADKLQVSNDHITECKIEIQREVASTFMCKKDFKIKLAERDEVHSERYRSNREEINKAKWVGTAIIIVFTVISFLLTNVGKISQLNTSNKDITEHTHK